MALTELLTRFSPERGYECTFCGQPYDRERRNCHACGVDAVSPRGR